MNPVLLIAVPLLAAFVSVILKKIDKVILMLAALFNTALSIYIAVQYVAPTVYTIGGFKPPFGISLYLDNYAMVGIVLINLVFVLTVLLSNQSLGKYSTVVIISMAALNGMVLTGDLFNLFVFMEIGAIAAYILTTMNKGFKHTFNYLVLGTLASGLFLFGIAVIYNLFGSLNLADIKGMIDMQSYSIANVMVLPSVLLFAGLSVEAKLLPFSGWVRGVLKDSNSLVGTLIVSAYAAAILLVFGRLLSTVLIMTEGLKIAFSVIAIATLVLGEFAAFSKTNIREVLLFSSIAQSGLVVLLFLYGFSIPAVLVLLNNVVSKLVLFSISAKISDETGSAEIDQLKGVFAKYRLIGLGFTVAAMSLIGLPFFFGFIAKAKALVALFAMNNLWLPIVILAVSVVEGAYIVRILANLWNTGEEGEKAKLENVKAFTLNNYAIIGIVTVLIGALIVASGILPITNIKEFLSTDFLSFLSISIGGV